MEVVVISLYLKEVHLKSKMQRSFTAVSAVVFLKDFSLFVKKKDTLNIMDA